MGDVANLQLGPCGVNYNAVDLGFTEGGVVLTIEDLTAEVKADQLGDAPVKDILMGRNVSVTVPLAEITADNINKAIPGSVKSGTTDVKVTIPPAVGRDLFGDGAVLILKPYVSGVESTDENDWVRFTKAAIKGSRTINYTRDGQRVLEVTFQCYPDSSAGDDIGYFGHSTPA